MNATHFDSQVALASICLPCISFATILFIRCFLEGLLLLFHIYLCFSLNFYFYSVVWEILTKFALCASVQIARFHSFCSLCALRIWSTSGFWNEKIVRDSWRFARAVLQVWLFAGLFFGSHLAKVSQRLIWWLQNRVRFFWKGRLHTTLIWKLNR